MSNVLNEHLKQQVIALGRLGWSLRRIEQETGVRRETVSTYLKAAGISVSPPGRRSRQEAAKPAITVTPDSGAEKSANQEAPNENSSKPAITVTPDFGVGLSTTGSANPKPTPASTPSACELFRQAIELGLRQGRNAKGIWQDLVSQVGFRGGYQSVKRFVRKLRGSQTPQACAVIVTAPGEEAQVDYGQGPMVRDPQSGKYRRTRLFVMTLGYSRKAVRLLIFRSSSRIWAELHEKAFRRLRGSPRVLVLDNLREGVLKPDIYDPTLNPLYRDVLAHYGCVALPCRVNHPDRKAYVSYGCN
jgi:transposase